MVRFLPFGLAAAARRRCGGRWSLRLWGYRSWGFGEGFADQAQRDTSREDGAVPLWLNFQAVEKCFYIGIGPRSGGCAFGVVKRIQQSFNALGQLLGFVITARECLSLEMDGSEIPHRSHDCGGFLEQE